MVLVFWQCLDNRSVSFKFPSHLVKQTNKQTKIVVTENCDITSWGGQYASRPCLTMALCGSQAHDNVKVTKVLRNKQNKTNKQKSWNAAFRILNDFRMTSLISKSMNAWNAYYLNLWHCWTLTINLLTVLTGQKSGKSIIRVFAVKISWDILYMLY